ncbi:ribulokinase [Aliifodinibius sp. S!AR15-10]|uniref:ribulokinase n=1 Tax=Aliifodinibius sp. S!AR15-10 TaxID=2950437 RepID=UPI00285ED355|nr:ribulokinase [Aliifodinibius sp. S!AR15-10]MDR8392949.1 ribulokinase [Aliifodinibius sp. S!AR15-10]
MKSENECVIGIDYGTDSVRSVLVDIEGNQLAESVHHYSRWKKGLYCDSAANQFRQHPLDYLEGLENTLKEVLSSVSDEVVGRVKGIAVDTTGSTPVAVDRSGTPLALKDNFAENPNAMFILWKDHTAVQEAEEITELAKTWGGQDYTKYVGGIYSSEWFWAKMLHTLRKDETIRDAAYSWVELCDWIPYELTGETDVHKMKRSRCAAGHKALWHEEFDGLPSEEFLTKLDPLLAGVLERLFEKTFTSDEPAGTISKEWAEKLGLPEDVVIAVGAFDAHMGAVGGEIEPYFLSKVMGTSTCDILVAPYEDVQDNLVQGICGQVDGSVIPGMVGLEAGQSAFGDVYAWFRDLILDPFKELISQSDLLSDEQKQSLIKEAENKLLPVLTEKASNIETVDTGIVALDWLNGRRTPDANQLLKGTIEGLDLGSDAAKVFKALVEATCFGAKAIVERFRDEDIRIEGIIGLGGVAKKSPFVMQTLANILDMPIKIAKSDQVCARGAAMFAATAAGSFESVSKAKESMGNGFGEVYEPEPDKVQAYEDLYQRYLSLGNFIENRIEKQYKQEKISQ